MSNTMLDAVQKGVFEPLQHGEVPLVCDAISACAYVNLELNCPEPSGLFVTPGAHAEQEGLVGEKERRAQLEAHGVYREHRQGHAAPGAGAGRHPAVRMPAVNV